MNGPDGGSDGFGRVELPPKPSIPAAVAAARPIVVPTVTESAETAKPRQPRKTKKAVRAAAPERPASPPVPPPVAVQVAEPPVAPSGEEPVPDEAFVVEPSVTESSVVESPVVEPLVAEPSAEPAAEAAAGEAPADVPLLDEPRPSQPSGSGPDAPEPPAAVAHPAPVPVAASGYESDVLAVQARGLSKSFGATRAVDGIDLQIPAGCFYGIVGPNGAGKTTTLSLLAGLLRPDAGTIEVAGVDLAADPRAAARRLGVLPDRLRTFDRLTGRQLLHYYGALRGLEADAVSRRAHDLTRALDMAEALSRPVSDYSTGMTKKIMLAGALIHSPRVLVLDEPFESVDPVSSAVMLEILSAFVRHGGTVVLSSHGMELVERTCSGVAVIVAGHVVAAGTVAEVRGEMSLEQRFLQLAGAGDDAEGLEWLHTFSD
ncbi:hypothetical protein AOA12_08765 [Microbacterium sp. No. 7]|nr:hypothetical protein AOA12_08765 [Microbacterium sp. No. 7]